MSSQNFLDLLKQRFPGEIHRSALINDNELYVEIYQEKVPELSRFLVEEKSCALVSLFAADERANPSGCFAIYYVFGVTGANLFIVFKTLIPETKPVFQSIACHIPAAQLYEREIQDLFGLEPQGHPDPRRFALHNNWPPGVYPMRRDFDGRQKPPFVVTEKADQFTRVQGAGVYEIPVGPVHAGIIEPGHFRFSVAGEPIINLEAQLFYVTKGIEKLCEGQSIEKCFYFAERISGDETFANSLAYCQAIEKIAGIIPPERANFSRVIFAEQERLVSHLGDLAGICVDIAHGFGASQFRMLRGWTYQMIEEVSNSRFLRSVNKPGGLRKDFITGNEKRILEYLNRIRKELTETRNIIKSNSLFADRVEHTGILSNQIAKDLNVVGPAGRASGVHKDLRKDHPYSAYGKLSFDIPRHQNGDVNCRYQVKLEECFISMDLIIQSLEAMPPGKVREPVTEVEAYRFALGYSEAPRGENIHWIMTGPDNTVYRYKVRTPSFCNWPALCHAVKGNVVPDFPLINKSFNLSYAGNDL